jgi:hypothetical protein
VCQVLRAVALQAPCEALALVVDIALGPVQEPFGLAQREQLARQGEKGIAPRPHIRHLPDPPGRLPAQARDQAGPHQRGLAAAGGTDDGDQRVTVDGLRQALEVRLTTEVEAGILLAEEPEAPVGADAGTWVRMCLVVELGRRLATDRAGNQIRGPRVPALDPGVLEQEGEPGLVAAQLVEQHRDHGHRSVGLGCPALAVQGRPHLALLPGPEAVAPDGHGDRPARREIPLQGRGPGLAGAQIPVVLEDLEPPLAKRLGQAIDITPVEPVVTQEEVELAGPLVHGFMSSQ